MKTMIRRVQSAGRRDKRLMFVCPGCVAGGPEGYDGLHLLPVIRTGQGQGQGPPNDKPSTERRPGRSKTVSSKPFWTWNGNLVRPTLSPSILTEGYSRCHSFLENGIFRFLEDSDHPLTGQSVPIPDLPAWAEELS